MWVGGHIFLSCWIGIKWIILVLMYLVAHVIITFMNDLHGCGTILWGCWKLIGLLGFLCMSTTYFRFTKPGKYILLWKVQNLPSRQFFPQSNQVIWPKRIFFLMWTRLTNKSLGWNQWIAQGTAWCLNTGFDHIEVILIFIEIYISEYYLLCACVGWLS